LKIRPCTEADLEAVNAIYNHYVRTSPATFDIEEIAMDARRDWFSHYADTGRYRVLVADDDGVVGFASASQFMVRRAYETSITVSVYNAADACGRGVGTALYEALFEAVAGEDVHRAYAGITMPNDASVALHAKFGFRQAGYFTQQGRKFDRYWDVAWFEKELT
jgi:phosphinothricin acetyltransferase